MRVVTNGEVGKVACGKFLKGCKLKRDKSGECKVNGVKGFSIGRAGEWNGKETLKGPTFPTLRGDQLKKIASVAPKWIAATKVGLQDRS